jgi:hypothetical protein
LSYTVWVDDLTVSGARITGSFRTDIRDIVAQSGLKSHKLNSHTGNRPVFITGIGVVGANLIVPKRIELRSKELWTALKLAQTFEEKDACSTRLLSHLGGIRAVVGASSRRGQKLASEMHSIRQKRDKARREYAANLTSKLSATRYLTEAELKERQAVISEPPF